MEWDIELYKKLSLAGEIRLNSVRGGIRDYKAIGDPVVVFGKATSSAVVFGLRSPVHYVSSNIENFLFQIE